VFRTHTRTGIRRPIPSKTSRPLRKPGCLASPRGDRSSHLPALPHPYFTVNDPPRLDQHFPCQPRRLPSGRWRDCYQLHTGVSSGPSVSMRIERIVNPAQGTKCVVTVASSSRPCQASDRAPKASMATTALGPIPPVDAVGGSSRAGV
jgi:hypothetical protein